MSKTRLKVNPDGSYIEREINRDTGNYIDSYFDKHCRKSGSVDRIYGEGGTYVDTTRDVFGKVSQTLSHIVRKDGSVKEVVRDGRGIEIATREVRQNEQQLVLEISPYAYASFSRMT